MASISRPSCTASGRCQPSGSATSCAKRARRSAEAHRRGLAHRDIKPANIYLCRRGIEHDVVKVLDLGIVKQVVPSELAGRALTRADAVAGTPDFMAPEMVLDPLGVDGRADLYTLGCVAFWLLTGRVVFEEETPTAAIMAHVQREPVPPSTASEMQIPEVLDRVVLDCLAKNPAARPQTAEALSARLAAVPLGRSWTEEDAAHWWETHHTPPASARSTLNPSSVPATSGLSPFRGSSYRTAQRR